MRHYRDVWLTVTAVVLVCGVWVAVADFTVATVLAVFVAAGVLGACAVLMVHDDENHRSGLPRLMAESVLIGLAAVAACGMFALLGAAAWLPLLLPVVASPWAVRHAVRLCRRRTQGDRQAAAEPPAGPMPAVPVEPGPVVFPTIVPADLDLDELCWAWRRSYVRLQRCRTVTETARVVAERQLCLDELERRNPGGLSAWLEAGARAAGDPSRYVRPAGPTDVHDNAA